MLFNLQPDRSITGRLWYNNENNEFESELVDLLNHQCFEMLQQQKEIAQQKQVN
jgi:DNA-directed RNA polymerase III subunit RPC6